MYPHLSDERHALRLHLKGGVQGVGLRPLAVELAERLQLGGCVVNALGGVTIEIEGAAADVAAFPGQLRNALPEFVSLRELGQECIPVSGRSQFQIEFVTGDGLLETAIPPDRAVCAECLADVGRRTDRRHRYAFTSCVTCGPRFSIIQAMPYERESTTMSGFVMCPECTREYEATGNRRSHAQTNACRQCGPAIEFSDPESGAIVRGSDAIVAATGHIRAGRILALKGLGGYQLLVDATNEAAVWRLRNRKQREGKPFAVMVKDVRVAEELAVMSDVERRALQSYRNPIVLVAKRDATDLAPSVSPAFNTVGLLLPTTPLHSVLAESCAVPLVATSGNRGEEPLAATRESAHAQLTGIADVWLDHDRPIENAVDDSVVRVMAEEVVSIRSARGFAPLPLNIDSPAAVLAVGGHQKVAIALSNSRQAVLGPHLGDMQTVAARERFTGHIEKMCALFRTRPRLIAHDMHPDYFTTRWSQDQSIPALAVQHHHAHVVAGAVEHGWRDQTVLGVAFDGSGYGPDGSVWGGEFLLADTRSYRRVGTLRPFPLLEGERAIREPWRVALALMAQSVSESTINRIVTDWPDAEAADAETLLRHADLFPVTSSVGRLFDGVAALAMNQLTADFEGQPAMLLESVCDPLDSDAYPILIADGDPPKLDWRPLIRTLLDDRSAGVESSLMAMRFHRGLATAIVQVCRQHIETPVVLTGGVFQNRVLLELVSEQLRECGITVGLPGCIPPNDGGLAAGQLAIAATHLCDHRSD